MHPVHRRNRDEWGGGGVRPPMKLMHKKFGALGDKIGSLTDFEVHFHDATDKMEKQFQRDNEARRKYY